jgi:membrane protease YdiL (CAAX protease family)
MGEARVALSATGRITVRTESAPMQRSGVFGLHEPDPSPDLLPRPPGRPPARRRTAPEDPSAPGPRPSPPAGWKTVLALVSLAMSILLWLDGLAVSLERPSVVDALSLRQLELAALAADRLPEPLRPALVGEDPRGALAEELQRQIEGAETPPPALQRLELALLQRRSPSSGEADQRLRGLVTTVDPARRPLLEALLEGRREDPARQARLQAPWRGSRMVDQLGCEQLGGPEPSCPAAALGPRLLLQLLAVNVLPLLLLAAGLLLLLRELWLWRRGRHLAPAPLVAPPLDLVDVVLLIAGGFVLIGEVVVPQLLQPPLKLLVERLALPGSLAQGLQVVLLYLGLMIAPLLLLAAMLPKGREPPAGGWLQWRWRPFGACLRPAVAMVLIVLPAVALASWLVERIWGDPGGSNPLLDLVLNSSDGWELVCFGLTATVLAPLFEETLFRGVLLPVLAVRLGGVAATLISAAVFAIAHLSLGELVPLFLLGIGLGWLRWRGGRLGAAALMHALWNALTFANLLVLAG